MRPNIGVTTVTVSPADILRGYSIVEKCRNSIAELESAELVLSSYVQPRFYTI